MSDPLAMFFVATLFAINAVVMGVLLRFYKDNRTMDTAMMLSIGLATIFFSVGLAYLLME